MAKKVSAELAKVGGPPSGGFWTWVTSELLRSPAWRAQSVHCRRLIEFLQVEHMAHGGSENGHLLATYDQLVDCGITRRAIHATISEAEQLGLIVAVRGGRKKFAETHLTRYRLTFLADRNVDVITGNVYFGAPTNDWRKITADHAKSIRRAIAGIKSRKNVKQHSEGKLNQFPNGNFDGSSRGTVEAIQSAETRQTPTVPVGEPLYISRLPGTGCDERKSRVPEATRVSAAREPMTSTSTTERPRFIEKAKLPPGPSCAAADSVAASSPIRSSLRGKA